jgi:hypothetical protein
VEQNQVLPAWRDHPEIVIELVQKYVPVDLDALQAARAAAVAGRDRLVDGVRAGIAEDARRREFDFWLDAGRRAVQAQENHNYFIDSAVGGLLHRAITACGRRLAAAGALGAAEDVWWLREHQVVAALQGLTLDPEARPTGWDRLVAAQRALHDWQRTLRAPPTLGAPPPPPPPPPPPQRPPDRAAGASPPEPPPAALLAQGQPGAAGRRRGRVRLVGQNEVVPDVRPGDVLVAHSAGALWGPVAPALAGVVLEVGGCSSTS